MSEEIATDPVKFHKNGDLTQDIDGSKTVIGHYDRKKRHVEFETLEYSRKLMRQVSAAIGTVAQGTQSSGLVIETIGVKGFERDQPTGKVPPRPKRGPLGDQTPAVVAWYFKYYPHEAYIRYGVFLDENGDPVRKKVKRRTTEIVDDREGDKGYYNDDPTNQGQRVANKSWEKGPIGQLTTEEVIDDQIIARRPTHMTFTPNEVVGGFDTGEEDGDNPDETTSGEDAQ